jgi:hypothetical protein
VHTSPDAACHSHQRVSVGSAHGFLSSTVAAQSRAGTAACPWHIAAKPGQKINITAYNFVSAALVSPDGGQEGAGTDNPVCYQFGTVTEGYSKRMLTVCSGGERRKPIYLSTSSEITVEFTDRRSAPQQSMQFLLEYSGKQHGLSRRGASGWGWGLV